MDVRRVCVIVPTYNERATIREVVRRTFEACPEATDVLVVDDGSPDGTGEEVRRIGTEDERVNLLARARKQGLGKAYIAGFRWALRNGYDVVVEMDADLSHDPATVPRLVAALDDADLAVGSRYIPEGRIENWGTLRSALSRFGNIYARILLGFDVRDSTSGFRAFRVEALKDENLDTVASHGYAFQIEMIRRLHRKGSRIVEVPITFVERASGISKMSKRIVLEAFWEVTNWGIGDRLRRLRASR